MIKTLGGGLQQVSIPFQPIVVPATPGDWSAVYSTQEGLMIVEGVLAKIFITVQFVPTFTTGGVGPSGSLRIMGHPIPFTSNLGDLQLQDQTASVTWPSSSTALIGRITTDLTAINLIGLRSAGSAVGLAASGLTSGSQTRFALAGTVRVG